MLFIPNPYVNLDIIIKIFTLIFNKLINNRGKVLPYIVIYKNEENFKGEIEYFDDSSKECEEVKYEVGEDQIFEEQNLHSSKTILVKTNSKVSNMREEKVFKSSVTKDFERQGLSSIDTVKTLSKFAFIL